MMSPPDYQNQQINDSFGGQASSHYNNYGTAQTEKRTSGHAQASNYIKSPGGINANNGRTEELSQSFNVKDVLSNGVQNVNQRHQHPPNNNNLREP